MALKDGLEEKPTPDVPGPLAIRQFLAVMMCMLTSMLFLIYPFLIKNIDSYFISELVSLLH